MKLYVKSLSGILSLEVEPEQILLDIKAMIQQEESKFLVSKQRLMDPEQPDVRLDDSRTIAELGWGDEKEIFLIIIQRYCSPSIEETIRILDQADLPDGQIDMLPYEEMFGLVRGREYIFPLRVIHRENPYIFPSRVNIRSSSKNALMTDDIRLYYFDSSLHIKGTFVEMNVSKSSSGSNQTYEIGLIISPPYTISIETSRHQRELFKYLEKTDKNISIPYLNLRTCEQFTGQKRSRSRLSRSVRAYIRKSLKKELRRIK